MKLVLTAVVVAMSSATILAQGGARGPLPDNVPLNANNLPKFTKQLEAGNTVLNLKNPSHFPATVQIRCGDAAKEYTFTGKGTQKLKLPEGEYTIYFRFKADRRCHEGRSFTVKDNTVTFDDDKTKTGVNDAEFGAKRVAKK